MSDEEIHDRSRVDGYARNRQRVAFLSAVWRPMLAGAAGASLVMLAVWIVLPKISYREVIVPAVTMRDTVVPNIVERDVPVDHVVPHETVIEIPIPRVVTVSPTEKNFIDSPAFANAPMHGRIVPSRSERALSFDDGNDYTPTLPGMAADAARFVGLWGYCSPIGATDRFHCFALLRDGTVVSVPQRPLGRPT